MTKTKSLMIMGAVSAGLTSIGLAAAITPGDLVVYQVGTSGGAALSSAATSVFVDEFTPAGTLVQSIALPDGVTTAAGLGQNDLVASGSATSEGGLTVSPDGEFIAVTGYNASAGTAGIASTSSSTTARVVGIINVATGAIDTSTGLTDTDSGNNFRSAVYDGTNIYTAGASNGASNASTGGIRLATLGASTSVAITNGGNTTNTSGGSTATGTNFADVAIYGGKLYASSTKSPNYGINLIGASPTATATNISNTGIDSSSSANPAAFVLSTILGAAGSGPLDEAYVADGNKILKYSLVSGAFVATGSITGVSNIEGLTGTVVNGNEVLYATNGTSIYSFTDNSGYDGSVTGVATSIATAPTGEAYRGVAVVPEPASLGFLACSGTVLLMRRKRKF